MEIYEFIIQIFMSKNNIDFSHPAGFPSKITYLAESKKLRAPNALSKNLLTGCPPGLNRLGRQPDAG